MENKTADTIESLQLQIKKLNRVIALQDKRMTRSEMVTSTRDKVMDMLKAERLKVQATTSAMFDANPQINILFDSNFKVIDCNLAAMQFVGFDTKEEMFAGFVERFSACIPKLQPDGRASKSVAERLTIAATEGSDKFETELHTGDTKKALLIDLVRIPYKNSFAIIAYAYDMTEMRNQKEKLTTTQKANEQQLIKLNAVVKATKIGLYDVEITDNNFLHPKNTVTFTDEFRNMLGYSSVADFPDTLENWKEHLHPDDRERAIADVIKHISNAAENTDNTPYDAEYRLLNKSGKYTHFRACGEAIRDNKGNVIRIAGALIDINTAIEKEMQLAKTNLMIKATKIGLWDAEIVNSDPSDSHTTIIYSDDFRRMIGYNDESDFPNVFSSWSDKLHPEDREKSVNAFAAHVLDRTGKTPFNIEYRLLKRDGEYSYFRAFGETIRDKKGNPLRVAGSILDITDEKNTIFRIEKLREDAEVASRAKSDFLSNMSHEIRTPLNAIIGMTTIGKSADDLPRKDYCFKKIENASQHLLGVINDILDLSKIEANKFTLSYIEFDFEKMLQRVVNIITFRADEMNQKLTVHIDNSIPQMLIGDDQRLAQVITNLLSNAVKFTPENGSVRVDTRFVREEDGECIIKITVTDTGIGISKENQQTLFDSFQQAETGTTRVFGGTGLGLAITKSIVEMMGGSIEVESELGKGSAFSFTFKAKRGIKRTPTLSEIGVNWSNVSIMVVDDDAEILDYFKEIIQGFGASCDTASSGIEALAHIGVNGMYDIYFVDWKMPDMDGVALARELKAKSENPDNTVIIMISAAEWSEIADEAKRAGVDKFLSKPLFPSAIADVITEAIGLNCAETEEKVGELDMDGVFKGYKILLAEDIEVNREIALALLEASEISIDLAENGEEAVELFNKSPDAYDLIFMDVQMPKMDGYEATGLIRKSNHAKSETIPIIAMTANVFLEDVEKCLSAGMNGHIGKPIDVAELYNMLRKYLKKT
ncbi:MAG: response regulator [Oscillospiraceae bacterium]|nr:response regulator [Oscillospiraceae bacterium]